VGRAFSVGVSIVSCALMFCALLAAPGYAQAPAQASVAPSAAAAPPPTAAPARTIQPVTGFVSAYEITKIATSAGFDPLAPPLREGTTYVLRATDYRGILMRVVIDARTGAIRDANRIVPGPGRYGQFGMASPYDPPDFDAPDLGPSLEPTLGPPPPVFAPTQTALPPPHTGSVALPPLPRPRPAALKPPLGSEVSTAAPPPTAVTPQTAPATAKKPALVEPLND
jgi:hypothetical protein